MRRRRRSRFIGLVNQSTGLVTVGQAEPTPLPPSFLLLLSVLFFLLHKFGDISQALLSLASPSLLPLSQTTLLILHAAYEEECRVLFCFQGKHSIRRRRNQRFCSCSLLPRQEMLALSTYIWSAYINITQMLFSINMHTKRRNMNLFCADNEEGVKISSRKAHPADCIFQVQSFSWLSKNSIDKYDSSEFESRGYKWKLSLYPDGNKNKKGKDHISLYLVIVDTDAFPLKWEVLVTYKLFVFNHITDKYVMLEVGSDGTFKRFHRLNTEWGFSQLIPYATFSDPSNGYLVDDTCVFGVEIFVYENTCKWECLSMVKDPTAAKYSWKIENFSKITASFLHSEEFSAGGIIWILQLYPMGDATEKNKSVSLFLFLKDEITAAQKIYTNYKLCLRDQKDGKHVENKSSYWFSGSLGVGRIKFVELERFKNPENGFLVNDTCFIEAEVTVLGSMNKLN